MTNDVEALVRGIHGAFSRGDIDGFLRGWDEQCEFQPGLERDMKADEDTYRGHEGIRRWWEEMRDAWSDCQSEVQEVRAAGDVVFVSCTLRAQGRLSGAVIEAPFFQVASVRGGKVTASRDFSNRQAALRAAGLSE